MSPVFNPSPFRRHAIAVALALAVSRVDAATIDVSGDCTLFNAINNANMDADTDGVGGCPPGSDADILNLPFRARIDTSLPTIASIITINGNGSTLDGQGTHRPLTIAPNGRLTINDITITKGHATKGGGIFNEGRLTITNSTITGNTTFPLCDYYCFESEGGGIYNKGIATVTNSSISSNSVSPGFTINGDSGLGGGILNTGTMTLSYSTVSHNVALGGHRRWIGPSGGGIQNRGSMTLSNTTVANNRVSGHGGGIWNLGTMTVEGSTISGNRAEQGGGLYNGLFAFLTNHALTLTNSTVSGNRGDGIGNARSLTLVHTTLSDNVGAGLRNAGSVTLANSLIANSVDAPDCVILGGTLVTTGTNLVEDGSCQAQISGDPQLDPLLHQGGYTATHALSSDSPARGAADPTLCEATDQRGITRPQPVAGACDVGAFERLTAISLDIKSLLAFFRNAINNGSLVGTGQNELSVQRREALRNQLLSAGHYTSQGTTAEACLQLSRTLKRIDPDNTPKARDYVTGSAAVAFIDKIKALLTTWACP